VINNKRKKSSNLSWSISYCFSFSLCYCFSSFHNLLSWNHP